MTETLSRTGPGIEIAPAGGAAEEASPFLNRELSWLEFNARVLAEAEDASLPLLERLKFIAIFAGNLDEFFMKRVGGLKLQQQSRSQSRSPDGRTPEQQLAEIGAWVRPRLQAQRTLLLESVLPELARNGLELVGFRDLQAAEREYLERFFSHNVFPILTPLGLDTSHPFPFISNLSLSLAVALRSLASAEVRFARLKVPPSLPRWIQLPDSMRFIALEVVIAEFLERLFPGMELLESYPFRVTRAADVAKHEEQAEDLLESVQEELQARRFASVVRLEVVPEMPEWMRSLLAEELAVGPQDIYEVRPPLATRDLFQLVGLPLPALQLPKWRPQVHPRLDVGGDARELDIFRVIRSGDLLVHHPYDAFSSSVERFLRIAAEDPAVLAIKQTLYRTSRNSPVVQSLIEAAERGKQVAVLVELKASFDEARNIEWAEALEGAGAHVAYGVVGYKTHAKVSLVVRQEADGVRTYVHLATGNYNTDTAELYTDLGLFSCDPALGADTAQLFNLLTSGHIGDQRFEKLVVAPMAMRKRVIALIAREAEHRRQGRAGRIVAKMNALEDPEIVRALYDASRAGVEIDLIVRGVCRLRPGVPGMSESIRVRSIVGRFLEHARIFHFGNDGADDYYIASADWMSRNLDYRVETMVPVESPELRAELQAILDVQLADNRMAWELESGGSWRKVRPGPDQPVRASQADFMEKALRRRARS